MAKMVDNDNYKGPDRREPNGITWKWIVVVCIALIGFFGGRWVDNIESRVFSGTANASEVGNRAVSKAKAYTDQVLKQRDVLYFKPLENRIVNLETDMKEIARNTNRIANYLEFKMGAQLPSAPKGKGG